MSHFRGPLIAASLKLSVSYVSDFILSYFRGPLIAASLKRNPEPFLRYIAGGLPRSFDRGLIEAAVDTDCTNRLCSNFRGPLIAASLKPNSCICSPTSFA